MNNLAEASPTNRVAETSISFSTDAQVEEQAEEKVTDDVQSSDDEETSDDDESSDDEVSSDEANQVNETNSKKQTFDTWITDARVILAAFVMFLALILAVVIVIFIENHTSSVVEHAVGTPQTATKSALLTQNTDLEKKNSQERAPTFALEVSAQSPSNVFGLPKTSQSSMNNNTISYLLSQNNSSTISSQNVHLAQLNTSHFAQKDANTNNKNHAVISSWDNPSREFTVSPDMRIKAVFDNRTLKTPLTYSKSGIGVKVLSLKNGMRVLLISNPNADNAAAAVNVAVGSFNDPPYLQGLSHLLEHMLFLGTDQHPGENEFSKFLNSAGGSSNAYTDAEDTNYYFNVQPLKLESALQRFAEFFKTPLLSPTFMDRERKVVHAEHIKNLQNDDWREEQLLRSTSSPEHPYHKFGTGNLDTLKNYPEQAGIDVGLELRNHFKAYYVGKRITAAILGIDSLQELERLAVDSFADVPKEYENKEMTASESELEASFDQPNKKSWYPDILGDPMNRKQRNKIQQFLNPKMSSSFPRFLSVKGHEIKTNSETYEFTNFPAEPVHETHTKVTTINPVRRPFELGLLYRMRAVSQGKKSAESSCYLALKFLIPYDTERYYRTKPVEYVVNLLNYKGRGSLGYVLRMRNLVNSIDAAKVDGTDSFCWLEIRTSLTKEGIAKRIDVYSMIVETIKKIKREGPMQWRWEEQKQIDENVFNYSQINEPSRFVSSMANSIRKYPVEDCLCGQYVRQVWSPEVINEVLSLLTEKNMLVFLISANPPIIENNDRISFAKHADSTFSSERRQHNINGAHGKDNYEFYNEFNSSVSWLKEKWYGTEYTVSTLPETFFSMKDGNEPAFEDSGPKLAEKNVWIATSLPFIRANSRNKDVKKTRLLSWPNISSHSVWNKGQSTLQNASHSFSMMSKFDITNREPHRSDMNTSAADMDSIKPQSAIENSASSHFINDLGENNAFDVFNSGTGKNKNHRRSNIKLAPGSFGCQFFWLAHNSAFDDIDPTIYIKVQIALPVLAQQRSDFNKRIDNILQNSSKAAKLKGNSSLSNSSKFSRERNLAKKAALLELYVRLLKDSLEADISQPSFAGFTFDVKGTHEGIIFSISGYPNKMLPFLLMIMSRVRIPIFTNVQKCFFAIVLINMPQYIYHFAGFKS